MVRHHSTGQQVRAIRSASPHLPNPVPLEHAILSPLGATVGPKSTAFLFNSHKPPTRPFLPPSTCLRHRSHHQGAAVSLSILRLRMDSMTQALRCRPRPHRIRAFSSPTGAATYPAL